VWSGPFQCSMLRRNICRRRGAAPRSRRSDYRQIFLPGKIAERRWRRKKLGRLAVRALGSRRDPRQPSAGQGARPFAGGRTRPRLESSVESNEGKLSSMTAVHRHHRFYFLWGEGLLERRSRREKLRSLGSLMFDALAVQGVDALAGQAVSPPEHLPSR